MIKKLNRLYNEIFGYDVEFVFADGTRPPLKDCKPSSRKAYVKQVRDLKKLLRDNPPEWMYEESK